MSGFQPANAALEGFRITRENPRAFLIWAGASFGINVLGIVVDALLPANIRHGLDTINAQETPTPGQFLDAIILASPVLVFALLVMSLMAAAVYRLIFRHDDTRFGYLRLGMDEVRLMAVTAIMVLVFIGAMVGAIFIVGLILGLLSLVIPNALTALQFPAFVAILGIVFFVMVRFSLAPVATFAERRIVVFESWGLTRGHVWQLLGAYALAVACIFVILALVMTIFIFIAAAILIAQGGQFADAWEVIKPKGTSLTDYLSVWIVAYMLVNSVFGALSNAVLAAPGAVAYRALHGEPPQPWATAQPEAG